MPPLLTPLLFTAIAAWSVPQAAHAQTSTDSYWARYEACMTGGTTPSSECTRYLTGLRSELTNLHRTLRPLGVNACERDGELLLGNGISIDVASCGERPGCGAVDDGATCTTPPPAAQTNAAGAPLASWCPECCATRGPGDSCSIRGCMSCSARSASALRDVQAQVQAGIAGLLQCFTERYPQPRLAQAIVRAYAELGATHGIRVRCPSNTGADDPAANAQSSTGVINLFPASMGTGAVPTALFGHEFMHLTGRCSSAHQIDNQPADVSTHNHPSERRRYETSADGSARPTGAERPYANRYYDRVYSCQALCFPTDFLSREQCSQCLQFGSTSTATPAPCASLPPLADLETFRLTRRDLSANQSELQAAYASGLATDRSPDNLFRFEESAGGYTYSYRGVSRPARSDAAARLLSQQRSVEQAAERLLAAAPAGARDRSALLFERDHARFQRIRTALRQACDSLQTARMSQARCREVTRNATSAGAATTCFSRTPPNPSRYGGLSWEVDQRTQEARALTDEWNQAVATLGPTPEGRSFDGATLSASPIAAGPACSGSEPNMSLNYTETVIAR